MTMNSLIRRCLIASIGLVFVDYQGVLAQTAWDTQSLMRAFAEVKEAQLTFVEHRTSAFLVDEIMLTGRMVYLAPDRIEKFVETPFVENIKIHGDKVTIEKISARGGSTLQSFSLSSIEALNTTVAGIQATLSGNFTALTDNYDIELSGDMSNWSVFLTPKKPEVLGVIKRIAVSGSDSKIKVIETYDADGDESRLSLSYQMIK